jgi:hypothetical protein
MVLPSQTCVHVRGPAVQLAALDAAKAVEARKIGRQVPGRHHPRSVEPPAELLDSAEGDVGESEVGPRETGRDRVDAPSIDLDVVPLRVATCCLNSRLLDVDTDDWLVPELRCRDREHPGAAADVEHAPALLAEEELETEARRRMRACAEGAPRVDDDCNRAARCVLPRRPDPERPDAHGPVKGTPPVLPARLDVGRPSVGERREHVESCVTVRGELDLRPALLLLEPLGRQLDEARAKELELAGACADRGADQRKALRSLLMKPSSASS